ncbi:MAG TPA: acyl-CoA dehydrogenase family protein [Actinomycetota bacterium]|nr:acyl-CoA dehydrogenase family protein [Actinomycetota bacterium]
MDFLHSDEQIEFYESVKAFAADVVEPGAHDRDVEGRFDRDIWAKLGEFGLLGLPIPEEYGGSGADIVTTCLALEALAEGGHDAGLGLSLGAHITIGTVPIWLRGTEEQKRRYLPKLCSGEAIGAMAITEPEAGSDAAAIKCRAVRDGDSWVLNGQKIFITNGSIADSVIVIAVSDPDAGAGAGVTAFIVDTDNPGFSVGRDLDKMGTRSSPLSLLHFDDCRVPGDAVLGAEGAALWQIAFECFDWERTVMIASSIGGMKASLTDSIAYAKERVAFGRPIARHQAIQHKIAEMKAYLDAARLVLYKAAWLKQEGHPHQLEASVAKLFVAEAAMRNAIEATQIFGGYGYIKEYPVERAMRDAKLISIGGGTSEIQKMIIARELLDG